MYRKGVGAVIINKEKKILIAKRNDVKKAWQMPQGGIDEGEDPKSAVLREIKEEIGTDNCKIIGQTPILYYDFPKTVQKRFFEGNYKGQKQIWFFLEFLGQDSEINLNFTNNPEFIKWKWTNIKEAIELIVDFKKEMYKDIYKYAINNNYLK